MKVSSIFKSTYLKGVDVETPITVTIAAAALDEGGNYGPRIVLDFKETEQKLSLNTTNRKTLQKQLGDDTASWIGKKVKLSQVTVRNPTSGEMVPSVLVTVKEGK